MKIKQIGGIGIIEITREQLLHSQQADRQVSINILGICIIARDVPYELAKNSIYSVNVKGLLIGWPALVKNAS
ncbi:MAG: hypothetical protein JEZ06_12465 [Anaerolineaceae bacterium]|nr:hypothetical protein [Anaerolineaceae bacterium]